MLMLNETHDGARRSWVDSANDARTDFPIQNLPHGVFESDGEASRGGIAIGDQILDLAACVERNLLPGDAARAAAQPTLNHFMAMGPSAWSQVRRDVSRLLDAAADDRRAGECLVPAVKARMQLPAQIGDFTDFYASIHHATNVGKLFRPDNPLLPNYKWVPIAYHGRASSICPSGTRVRRPIGQTRGPDAEVPTVGPARRLDYETELALFVGPGNPLGSRVPLDRAPAHMFGLCLLNDWSARDLQAWEYQPLGPFLAKSFASTVSPWIVTMEALAPFRVAAAARAPGDPEPLPYLSAHDDRASGAFDIHIRTELRSLAMRQAGLPALTLADTNAREAYWTFAQMLAHHSSNGCNLRPGDLIGSGTLSGSTSEARGSIIEHTLGRNPLTLPSGESRLFVEDGDEIRMTARCARDGYASIGFGACVSAVEPAQI